MTNHHVIETLTGKEIKYTAGEFTTGTIPTLTVSTALTLSGAALTRTGQIHQFPAAAGKAGATATVGYVNTGTDTGMVTLAQNATADTFVIPITGLREGDIITSVGITGQIESGGNTATVDYALRAQTAVATGSTDAAIQAGTQVSKTADYLMNETTAVATPETVTAGKHYYILVTCTTAASTDVELLNATLTITHK